MAGNVNWIKDYKAGGTQTQTFSYDGLDRLTSVVVSYLLSDHLGSTSVFADAGGAWAGEQRYKAWGEVLGSGVIVVN